MTSYSWQQIDQFRCKLRFILSYGRVKQKKCTIHCWALRWFDFLCFIFPQASEPSISKLVYFVFRLHGGNEYSVAHSLLILGVYCWFSHDVTKIQTKKLSILPRIYFRDALEQLKTNFHTNFLFKRVLGFVIEYAWISKLCGEAFTRWWPRELSCRLKKMTCVRKFCYLNSSCIRKSIILVFLSLSKNKFTLL